MPEPIDWLLGRPVEAIEHYLKWRGAVEKADSGDLSALVDLLRSEVVLGPESRSLIADLLGRKRLANTKGGQRRPAYKTDYKQGKLQATLALVRYHHEKGLKVHDAIMATLREQRREAWAAKDKERAVRLSDDEVDATILDKDIDRLENAVKKFGINRRVAD